jgi:hypothetical protein
MDALMLDGNAVAGLLQEVFAVEMTTAIGTFNTCGVTDHVGRSTFSWRRNRHALPRTATTIVENGPRVWIGFAGVRTLQVAV